MSGAEEERPQRVLAGQQQQHEAHDGRRDQPAGDPLGRLARRDVGREVRPPEAPADEVGATVVGPDGKDGDEQPDAAPVEPAAQGRPDGQGRRALHDEQEEAQQAHVERPEDRGDPGLQPGERVRPQHRRHGRHEDADGHEEDGHRRQVGEEPHAGDDDERHGGPQQRLVDIAGQAQEDEGLPRRERRDQEHQQTQPRQAGPPDDQHDGHEDGRTRHARAEHGRRRVTGRIGASASRNRPGRYREPSSQSRARRYRRSRTRRRPPAR